MIGHQGTSAHTRNQVPNNGDFIPKSVLNRQESMYKSVLNRQESMHLIINEVGFPVRATAVSLQSDGIESNYSVLTPSIAHYNAGTHG